jgi:hypothetical protein
MHCGVRYWYTVVLQWCAVVYSGVQWCAVVYSGVTGGVQWCTAIMLRNAAQCYTVLLTTQCLQSQSATVVYSAQWCLVYGS